MPKIAIFDIDGVLADNSLTAQLDCGEPAEMAIFARMIPHIKPVKEGVAALLKADKKFGGIYLFTARSAAVRIPTQNWLYDYKIPHSDLFMRPFGNNDAPAVLKSKMLANLQADTGAAAKDIIAFDDDAEVVRMYLAAGVRAKQVKLG